MLSNIYLQVLTCLLKVIIVQRRQNKRTQQIQTSLSKPCIVSLRDLTQGLMIWKKVERLKEQSQSADRGDSGNKRGATTTPIRNTYNYKEYDDFDDHDEEE